MVLILQPIIYNSITTIYRGNFEPDYQMYDC